MSSGCNVRLLWFNLAADRAHPALSFAMQWIEKVADQVDGIDVISMRVGDLGNLPPNVRVFSVGAERGYSDARRAAVFYLTLIRLLLRHRYSGCFSHMMPLFSAMAGPVIRSCGIPLTTWYAHPTVTRVLKVSHFFSTTVVASLPHSYPYRTDKLVLIGQGIDEDLFSPDKMPPSRPPLILAVGRIAPVKDQVTLLRAVANLRDRRGSTFRVAIVGPITNNEYYRQLQECVAEMALTEMVSFFTAVRREGLPWWYRRSTVHVNMTPLGSGDKVVLEALACGRLCVVANPAFAETLGDSAASLTYPHGDYAALADRLDGVLSMSETERDALGLQLRRRVTRMHGLASLARRIIGVTTESQSGAPMQAEP